jgi:hypothetical protein
VRQILNNKWVLYSSVLILLVILIVLIKIAFTPTNNLSLKNTMTTLIPTQTPKIVDLCAPFAKDPAKISCNEAKTIAIKEFPGSISKIDKDIKNYTDPNRANNIYKLWLVTIKLSKSIKNYDELVIGVDITDGKIKYSELK